MPVAAALSDVPPGMFAVAGCRPAAPKIARIVYRYRLNAARRARLANCQEKDLPDDYDLGTHQFGQRPESVVVLRRAGAAV
jgi:hypothetical protein